MCGQQILLLAVCASVLAWSLAKLSLLAAARRFIFAPERRDRCRSSARKWIISQYIKLCLLSKGLQCFFPPLVFSRGHSTAKNNPCFINLIPCGPCGQNLFNPSLLSLLSLVVHILTFPLHVPSPFRPTHYSHPSVSSLAHPSTHLLCHRKFYVIHTGSFLAVEIFKKFLCGFKLRGRWDREMR